MVLCRPDGFGDQQLMFCYKYAHYLFFLSQGKRHPAPWQARRHFVIVDCDSAIMSFPKSSSPTVSCSMIL